MLAAATQSTAGTQATAMTQATTVTPTAAEMDAGNSGDAKNSWIFAEICEKLAERRKFVNNYKEKEWKSSLFVR